MTSEVKLDTPVQCCGKVFKYQAPYLAHLNHHQQCDACTFSGSRRALNEHMMKAHMPAIVLNTPEEIEQWREQRRKKFPTMRKLQKKREEKLKEMHAKALAYRQEELQKRTTNEEVDMECSEPEESEAIHEVSPILPCSPPNRVLHYKLLHIIATIANA